MRSEWPLTALGLPQAGVLSPGCSQSTEGPPRRKADASPPPGLDLVGMGCSLGFWFFLRFPVIFMGSWGGESNPGGRQELRRGGDSGLNRGTESWMFRKL